MNRTILIIEDNPLNLNMAKDFLEMAGFQVLEALDAELGIQLAKQYKPNLILMDFHMPEMNGYEACEVLQSDPETQDIILIGFTALVSNGEQKKAFTLGCRGIITKPINVDQFAKQVESYMYHI